MKNFKSVVIGFVAGALCMVSVTAFGAYNDITAKLFSDVTFNFDGERVAPPSDLPVLNYNNHTYVPLRYVAETLGATVDWDIPTRTVRIQRDKTVHIKEVEVEKIVYVEKGEIDGANAVYSSLPLRARNSQQVVEVSGIARDTVGHSTKIFVTVENDSGNNIKLDTGTVKLIVDGKEVDKHAFVRLWDSNWDSRYISSNDEYSGFLIFNLLDEDYSKVHLSFDVVDNLGDKNTYDFYFKR